MCFSIPIRGTTRVGARGKSASASEKLSVGIGKEWRGRIRAGCPERQLVQDKKFGEGGAREVSTAGSFDTGEEFRSCGC